MRPGSEKLNRLSAGILRAALWILVSAALLTVLYRGSGAAYRFGYNVFLEKGIEEAPGTEIHVAVPEGTDAWHTAMLLKRKGIIDNLWAFRIQALFFGLEIRPGNYTLNTSETVEEILEQLNAGPDTSSETGKEAGQ